MWSDDRLYIQQYTHDMDTLPSLRSTPLLKDFGPFVEHVSVPCTTTPSNNMYVRYAIFVGERWQCPRLLGLLLCRTTTTIHNFSEHNLQKTYVGHNICYDSLRHRGSSQQVLRPAMRKRKLKPRRYSPLSLLLHTWTARYIFRSATTSRLVYNTNEEDIGQRLCTSRPSIFSELVLNLTVKRVWLNCMSVIVQL